MSTDTHEILTLNGGGYTLSVSAADESRKLDLVTAAGAVTHVTTNDESGVAQFHLRNLAGFRTEVEKSRVAAKKPVLELGKRIDAAAAEFIESITLEEKRLNGLIGGYAEDVRKKRIEAEAEERRKADEARRVAAEAEKARQEAEAATAKASQAVSIADVIAARQAERAASSVATVAEQQRVAVNAEKFMASTAVATTHVAQGVRFEPDFEVVNIAKFHAEAPQLVELTPRRRETLAWLKGLRADGTDIEKLGDSLGLKITLKPVVSTR